jgi:tRNA A37 methylthiotransferase MiaB
MNRKYSAAEFKHIIDKFRTVFPTLTLSTDVIVGFPGETEAEFQSTVELLTAVQPNIVNIKAYSPRGNTKASKLSGKLPNWIIKVRTRALTKLRFQLSLNLNLRLVGSVQYVLVTECGKPGTDTMICRTDDYNPVVIREHVNVGTFGAATITDATDCYLIGKFN